MKLNEITQLAVDTVNLTEGVIPPHLTMTLDQVIKAGKITNNVQTFVMADLANMFKNGGPTRWPRELNSYPMNAGTEMINAIRELTNEEAVELAAWLLTELQNPAKFESNPYPYHAPQLNTAEWVRWVLRRQD